MKDNYLQLIGWLGMVLILTGYFLVTFSVIESSSAWFYGLNLVGSLGIILVTWKRKDYQSMILNVVWALIAIVAVVNFLYSNFL